MPCPVPTADQWQELRDLWESTLHGAIQHAQQWNVPEPEEDGGTISSDSEGESSEDGKSAAEEVKEAEKVCAC